MPITRSQTALTVSEREAAAALLQLRKATMRPLSEETVIQRLERILTRSGGQQRPVAQKQERQRPPQRAAARRANQLLKLCVEADNE